MNHLLLSFLLLTGISGFAQSDSLRNRIYVGGGRQGLLYLKYEYSLVPRSHFQTNVNLGIGGIPGDHDAPENSPRHTIFTPEILQLIGFHDFYLELGIEPAIHFFGNVTYTDLNGIVGLRYQSSRKRGVFAQFGYNPRLYYTFESDVDVPFYAGVGIVF